MSSSFLITGLRLPAALDWVRRLGRNGHRVAAADSLKWPLGRTSRYLSRYRLLPPPREDSLAYAQAVARFAAECGAEWIIPNSEEIFYLARHRSLFQGGVRLLAEPLDVLETLHQKGKFARFTTTLQGTSIQAPESHECATRQELRDFADARQDGSLKGWVLKAAFSRFSARVHVHPGREVIERIDPTADNPWIIQRHASGDPVCSYSLAVNGVITAHAAYVPRHCFEGGAGCYFEPVERPELLEFARAVVGRLGFTGQISFDFIRGESGTQVIECNPRATSGLFLLDERDPLPFLKGDAGTGIWPMDDTPRMLSTAMWMMPGRRARWEDYKRARDVIFVPDDRLGLLALPLQIRELVRKSRRMKNGYNLVAAASEDCEWNGGPMR